MTHIHTPTRLLFVDDEEMVLQGLKRQFRKYKDSWDMRFAISGHEALKMLKESPADVVVSDMRMPQMDGSELMMQIRDLYPETIRFVLSGQTDQGTLMSGIGSIHQFIQKPCEEDVLVSSIERARKLSGEITSRRCAAMAGKLTSLPVLSSSLSDLRHAIAEGEDCSELGAIVARDPGLSCKLLQLVNSAFFGIPRKVDSVHMAVTLLGLQQLESICTSIALFDAVSKNDPSNGMIERIWRKCVDIGACAAKLAKDEGRDSDFESNAQQAGMLSHIGRAMFVRSMPVKFERALQLSESERIPLLDAEREVLGANQDALSAYMLGMWAFNDKVIEAVYRQSTSDKLGVPEGCDLGNYVYRARLRTGNEQVMPHPPGSPDSSNGSTRSVA